MRKAANPVVGGAIVAAAAYAAYSQLRTRPQPLAPSPSPLDLTGAVRIACDQHATLIGFVLAGIVAGFATAEEAESGAIDHAFLAQSSLWRIWFARLAAVLVVLVTSLVVTAVSVRIASHWIDWSAGSYLNHHSGAGVMFADLGATAIILCFVASLATCLALITRSTLLTVGASVVILILPTAVYSPVVDWLTPTGWIVEALHLVDFGGGGIDYVLSLQSFYDRRGTLALVSIGLLATSSVVLGAAGVFLLRRLRSHEGLRLRLHG